MKQTIMCVRCLRQKATKWSGHVLIQKSASNVPGHILAGWCHTCFKAPGFVGHYLPGMWMEQHIPDLGIAMKELEEET